MEDPNNNGLFNGMMELALLGSSLKQMARGRKKKGTPDRHIIKRYVKDGREHYLHATKGWKSRRV